MSHMINNTLIELVVKMLTALLVVIGLLALSAKAEAATYKYDLNQQKSQSMRLQGQLRSSIAFERSFDNESIFLKVKGDSIYIAGEFSSAQQHQNLIEFVVDIAPNYTLVDTAEIAEVTVRENNFKVAKLFNWVSI